MAAMVQRQDLLKAGDGTHLGRISLRRGAALSLVVLAAWSTLALGADLPEAETLFRHGRYDECAAMAAGEVAHGVRNEAWSLLKVRSEVARGKSDEALTSLEDALRRYPFSLPMRLLARDVYRSLGRAEEASAALDLVERLITAAPQRFATPEARVGVGRYFLLRGADARKVLDQFYDVAIRERPGLVEAYLATAELALGKQDHALAVTTLEKAPKEAADEPHYHYLLARAFSDDDRARSTKAIADALAINPRHVESLLLRADHQIDAERYQEADDTLTRALDVNPHEPRAWAYRAVLAHLRGDRAGEDSSRREALSTWAANPEVDHLIGRKLSQKYRFDEGAAAQRRALRLDPDDLPAKIQLCQDLLRLGEEDAGWALADEVFARDAYNIVAYNLITLRDRLAGFTTLKDDGFILRMEPREAALYGTRVLSLLKQARKTLCAKYETAVEGPVIVEIFPQKKEFAVRTFGLPGADGLLGVCFGRVITANSPASQGESPANWEAVLWHEFCHAVTLTKTRNRMPRWLSEGISVYEEERQDHAWGTSLDPRFRALILGETLTPISRLSSAFLTAGTALDLQFAYFESGLAVDYLVRQAGLPAVKGLLDDLGAGALINEALPARAKMTLEEMDRGFARFARERAQGVAPGATWDEPDLPANADASALSAWLDRHPKSFPGWRRLGAKLVAEGAWEKARDALETFKGLDPEYVGPENAYVSLAAVYRRLNDPARERAALEALAARDASAGPAYLRLMELDEAEGNWKALALDARRMLAVNPLAAAPHRMLARADERLGERDEAIDAYRALALLDDTDPAEIHFRLATLLRQRNKPAEARREVLKALEEAPRFLEPHRLLLELIEADSPKTPADAPPNSTSRR